MSTGGLNSAYVPMQRVGSGLVGEGRHCTRHVRVPRAIFVCVSMLVGY